MVTPKRKSLLQKKLQSKNTSMIDKIFDGKENDKQEGRMASMSFGGHSASSSSVINGEEAELFSGPVRSSSGCPVNHSKSSSDTQSEIIHENKVPHDAVSDIRDEHDSRKSSQPFREEAQDDLPEIQVSAFIDLLDRLRFISCQCYTSKVALHFSYYFSVDVTGNMSYFPLHLIVKLLADLLNVIQEKSAVRT